MGKLCDDNLNEMNYEQTSPLDLSRTGKLFHYPVQSPIPCEFCHVPLPCYSRQISFEAQFKPPKVVTEPKREWHYRSIKDLAKNHLPYLSGIGPQRTPIRVTVPPAINREMYLAIGLRTISDNEPHPSKVIVPAKTYVNTEHLSHDNDLNCLLFDQCNPKDIFKEDERTIYSEITPGEHQIGYKEVRVHMFNLYQNQYLTKELIITKQLNQCKLAFFLCIRQGDEYIPITDLSFSSVIEEKKMTTRSRPSAPTQANQASLISNPYAQFLIDYCNTDEENSF